MGEIGILHEQGLRSEQQDRYITKRFKKNGLSGWLIGVFDGHSDEAPCASELCAHEFAGYFEPANVYDVRRALYEATRHMARSLEASESGTTLSVICILESHDIATAAVIGDSPIVMENSAGSVWHSPQHNVHTNPEELRAAIARGARKRVSGHGITYICRHMDGPALQLSRALGDKSLRPILSDEPAMYTIRKPRHILVASDGILDSMLDSRLILAEALCVAKSVGNPTLAVHKLRQWRMERGALDDNVTAILWQDI